MAATSDNPNIALYDCLSNYVDNIDNPAAINMVITSKFEASCGSWIRFWRENTGTSASEETKCFRKGCSKPGTHGGHVLLRGAAYHQYGFIIPLCPACNIGIKGPYPLKKKTKKAVRVDFHSVKANVTMDQLPSLLSMLNLDDPGKRGQENAKIEIVDDKNGKSYEVDPDLDDFEFLSISRGNGGNVGSYGSPPKKSVTKLSEGSKVTKIPKAKLPKETKPKVAKIPKAPKAVKSKVDSGEVLVKTTKVVKPKKVTDTKVKTSGNGQVAVVTSMNIPYTNYAFQFTYKYNG